MEDRNDNNRKPTKSRIVKFISTITPSTKVDCKRCACTRLDRCENCTALGVSESSQTLAYFGGNDALTTMTVQQLRTLYGERNKAFGKASLVGNPLSVYLDGERVAAVDTGKQLGFVSGVMKRAIWHFPCFCYVEGSSLRGVLGGDGGVGDSNFRAEI